MIQPIKVAVTGAAGNIGYALVFRIASGQVFGPDMPVELQLLEISPALDALRGVAMELQDCAFPLLKNVVVTDDPNVAFRDVNYAALVGAVPRKKGMERSDLLKINGALFQGQGKAISENAADDVKVLVIGNPCNTNALIAMHHAHDVPCEHFYAMTMLDQKRAVAQLAAKAGVSVSAVNNMIIWGNHSSTQYPDFHNATINGKPAVEVIDNMGWFTDDFFPTVQKRGAAIIEARGLSSAASAANAIIDNLRALHHDTPNGQAFSVARCSNGDYGVDEGLIFSFPCQTTNGEVAIVQHVKHNEYGQQKLKETLDELRSEKQAVKDLGLIG